MINRLHFIYICIIFAVVLIALIVGLSKTGIDPIVFDNVSFASTIVSIVLAVVSIVYSIVSGAGVANSLSHFKEIEERMSSSIDKLDSIEKLSKSTNSGVASIQEKLTNESPAKPEKDDLEPTDDDVEA